MSDDRPLPYGWIKEHDANYQQPYYVDTKATPPRSIWVHPYDDEQYLREHPDIREKVGNRHDRPTSGYSSPLGPPPLDERPSSSYRSESSSTHGDGPASDRTGKGKEKKGFFGKLKDKAIGTKEEREAARLQERQARLEQQRRMEERRHAAVAARQQYYDQQRQQGYGQQGYANGYGAPPSSYFPQQQGQYGPPPAQRRRAGGLGGGGMALPLIGGLAGGLLLGDVLGGGGDFGGGDFGGGGGDFGGGGGDFGGGGF
ncbi:hypothetical protein DFH11DRAFT_1558898 [Phellopilus nigrolimitatus]|nr:hypothetical protein DFH11DRAFT_1558898 [Phellopilus nigrolimitatus]